jgi:hypothetical protein
MQQALVHHSQTPYKEAVKSAAKWARDKFDGIIANSASTAQKTLDYLNTHQPEDTVVPAPLLDFDVKTGLGQPELLVNYKNHKRTIHRNALIQMAEKAGLPSATAISDFLIRPNQVQNFANILNSEFGKKESKHLLRAVDNQVRGFLSDKYRRLDSRPMIDALIDEAVKIFGAQPVEASILDTSVSIKLVMPQIFEPVPGEVGVFGLCFRTSDFGHGRLWLKGFFWRLWCTNLALTEDNLSQIHLGGRLSENIEFSRKTMELDTRTMASAIRDVTRGTLSEHKINENLAIIQKAHGQKLDGDDAFKALRVKNRISKGEEVDAKKLFSSADIEDLPPGPTAWRLSNTLSLLAQKADPDRKLELENLAGEVAGLHRTKDTDKELN